MRSSKWPCSHGDLDHNPLELGIIQRKIKQKQTQKLGVYLYIYIYVYTMYYNVLYIIYINKSSEFWSWGIPWGNLHLNLNNGASLSSVNAAFRATMVTLLTCTTGPSASDWIRSVTWKAGRSAAMAAISYKIIYANDNWSYYIWQYIWLYTYKW